jgi:RNA polymerase sigma factor (sigma-70 family)
MDFAGASDPAAAPRASFGALYADVAPSLVAWASVRVRRALRAWVDPEDLVQETMVRAFDRFASFDSTLGNFRQWVFGIANNVLKEILAAAAKPGAKPSKLAASSRVLLDQLPQEITSISRRLMRDEAFAAFVARLDELEDDDRKLVLFVGFEGLGHEASSRLLGISIDAGEKRWQRLRRRLEAWRPPADLFAR